MLNAQTYHYPQPTLRVVTGWLPVNPYYGSDPQYDVDGHADNYMLSPATPLTPQDPYGAYTLPDNLRPWSSYGPRYPPTSTSTSTYARYSGYDASHYTTEPPTRARPVMAPIEGPSNVFSTHSLHSSLPHSLPNPVAGGRELPHPSNTARVASQMQSYEASQIKASAYPKGSHLVHGNQSKLPTRNSSVTSARPVDLDVPASLKPTTISTTSSEASPLPMLPSSSASPDISPTTTTAPPNQSSGSGGMSQHGTLSIDHSSMYNLHGASLSDTRLQHVGPTSNTYTFSIARRDPQQSSTVSCNGGEGQIGEVTTYVPLSYPSEPTDSRTFSMGSSRHGSVDGRMHTIPQRSSMPSIGQEV